MNRFIGLVKITFLEGLTYRTQFLADVSVGCVYLLSFYYLWHAIYAGRTEIAGISLASMVAYTLVSTLIGFIVRQDVNIMVADKVYTGDIATELTKPMNYQQVALYTAIGQALFNLFFKGVPVFILFGYILDIAIPFEPTRLLLAAFSCVLGFVMYFLIDLSLGCVSFWITQTYGVNQFKNVFMAFCAGGIMPLDFYPAFLRDTLAIMPFKGCFYTPLAIYLEVAPQDNALYAGLLAYVPNYEILLIIEQLTWILIVLGLSQVLWKKALRKIVILGG